ncbi:hypothetical protein [Meiothermus taiwanensis]|uniref:Uncharacterized protein n=2 Tax=Meiothermus taiwanensis TaxID=172827 RepID=A0A399E1S9_9DEIN|nr:hypothetical protein [Meiothermus taiwanensis]AWR86645.1 hypothetical protein Mtai_v1c14030 [Meiothermus taiwanensis WR-220]KIQ53311.1 hypothetical protein SY28_14545 [Meiothermus taiwanensis]KZK16004.1 hypothetical protein A3962_00830 [Meiothermus taiwanensis]RIH78607.1 hypothetical protein Mcate_00785 [Meiothermus taiwanensis]
METNFVAALLMAGLVFVILFSVWYPHTQQQKADRNVRALSRMLRHARRHNTMVRYHNGVPFVVTHQRRGLVYMHGGRLVSREQLVNLLGSEAVVRQAEQEESMQAPNPTRLTIPS